jgi:hypothetical protein
MESRRATLEPTAKTGFAVDPVLGRPGIHRQA